MAKKRYEIACYVDEYECDQGIVDQRFFSDNRNERDLIVYNKAKEGFFVEVFDTDEFVKRVNPVR